MSPRISIRRKVLHPNRIGGNLAEDGGSGGDVLFEQHVDATSGMIDVAAQLHEMARQLGGVKGLDVAGAHICVVLRLHPPVAHPPPSQVEVRDNKCICPLKPGTVSLAKRLPYCPAHGKSAKRRRA